MRHLKKNNLILLIILVILIGVSIIFYIRNSNSGTGIAGADHITQTAKAEEDSYVGLSDDTADFVLPEAGTELGGYTIILHTNDTHGRVEPDSEKGQMGFTAVSALKKRYLAAGAEVILLDAGDTLHGTDFAINTKGKNIVSLMNLVGYDAMAPGNNDFNYGTKTLLKRSEKMDFPLLSANVIEKDNGEKLLKDRTIITKSGVKYGIFGLTTTDTALKKDVEDVDTLEFINPIDTAKEEVSALKEEGADVIIALTHIGTDKSSEFNSEMIANEVEGIDIIVDGHSHTAYQNGYQVANTLIVSSGEYIENIGVVTIDPDGNKQAQLVDLTEFSETDPVIDKFISENK